MTWFVTKELVFSYLVCFDFFFVVFVSTFLLRPTCILWVKMYLLAFINRRGGLYGRILTDVVSTDLTQWVLYSTRFSHTDRLSSVNKMFIWQYKHKMFIWQYKHRHRQSRKVCALADCTKPKYQRQRWCPAHLCLRNTWSSSTTFEFLCHRRPDTKRWDCLCLV